MLLSPRKQKISDILTTGAGSFIAGIIGSIIILIVVFLLSNYFNIVSTFEINKTGTKPSSIFPILISIITLLGTSITSYLSYFIANMTDSEKYKRNNTILSQLAIFHILIYIFITPIYIYIGVINYNDLIYIFILHVIIIIFGTSLMLEIFNSYRYILIGFYGSFIGLFLSILFSMWIFNSLGSGSAKMIILLLLLPIINFLISIIKQFFEFLYYLYYKYTSLDTIGDIFYQIEQEENEKIKIEEEKNTI
ncbi:MAG: hypothetical protein PHI37_05160 [Candidatus Gracilibacteria bacterium]|nr:hypothetical protein [Candidatus Gracilibacteria bacterium]